MMINRTLFEAITGQKPDIQNLRTFGCRIFAKKPGKGRPSWIITHPTVLSSDTHQQWKMCTTLTMKHRL